MTSSSSPRFTGFIRDVRSSKQNLQQTLSQVRQMNILFFFHVFLFHHPRPFLQPFTANAPTNVSEQQPYTTATTQSTRLRADSSTATSSIDPFHYQALQDTNEALKSEVHRLACAEEDNNTKFKLQVFRILFFLRLLILSKYILYRLVKNKSVKFCLSCFF